MIRQAVLFNSENPPDLSVGSTSIGEVELRAEPPGEHGWVSLRCYGFNLMTELDVQVERLLAGWRAIHALSVELVDNASSGDYIEVLINDDLTDAVEFISDDDDGVEELLPFSIPEGAEIWLTVKKCWSSVTAGGSYKGSPVGGQIIDIDNLDEWEGCRLRWPRGECRG